MSEKNRAELESILGSLKDDDAVLPAALRVPGASHEPASASVKMPAAVDARIQQALAEAVARTARGSGSEQKPASVSIMKYRVAFAAAAGILLAFASFWFISEGLDANLEISTLGRVGNVLADGARELSPGEAWPERTRLELKEQSILYAALGEHMRLRIAGPARVRYEKRKDGIELYLEQGRLDIRSGGTGVKGFRLVTARSRIELLGTMLAVRVDEQGEVTRLLEGRLRILEQSGVALELAAGEKLEVRGPVGDTNGDRNGGKVAVRKKTTLTRGDRLELKRIDGSLASAKAFTSGKTGADGPGLPRSLEDIRSMYGFVSEYELTDGRRLQGYLLTRNGGSYVLTVKGMLPVRQSDIQSIRLIE